MGGGAWPFLVGGVICLVNSDNERDSVLLNSWIVLRAVQILLLGRGGTGRLYRRGVLRHKAPFRYQALFTLVILHSSKLDGDVLFSHNKALLWCIT